MDDAKSTRRPALERILRRAKGGNTRNDSLYASLPPMEFVTDILKAAPGTVDLARDDRKLHVSTLLLGCPRKATICALYGMPPPPKVLNHPLGLTFAFGNAMHAHVQRALSEQVPHRIYGRWRCVCGALNRGPCTLADIPEGLTCRKCETKPNVYSELSLVDENRWIVGNPDILLLCQDGKLQITELKSLSDRTWDDLDTAQPDHILQALFYHKLAVEARYPVTTHVSVLYAVKGRGLRWPYKEFLYPVAPMLSRIDPFLATAEAHKKALTENGPLPGRICSAPDCAVAKSCHVGSLCFALPE